MVQTARGSKRHIKGDAPWFKFYVARWIVDTLRLSPAQRGAYIDLLCHAWEARPPGTLPDDDAELAILSRLNRQWKRLGGPVRSMFETSPEYPGRLVHPDLVTMYSRMAEEHERRSEIGRRGAEARYGRDSLDRGAALARERDSVAARPGDVSRAVGRPEQGTSHGMAMPPPCHQDQDGHRDSQTDQQKHPDQPPSETPGAEGLAGYGKSPEDIHDLSRMTTERRRPAPEGGTGNLASAEWLGELRRIWRAAYGGELQDSDERLRAIFAPLLAGNAAADVVSRFQNYCAEVAGQYASLPRFAATFGQWRFSRRADTERLVQRDGEPLRVTRF
jgi:uncharacterized protein YdaU (DUF1376 family)